MTDMQIQASFDYSAVSPDLAESLKERGQRIREIQDRAIIDVGRELAEAQQDLADHAGGTFQKWAEAETGLSRGTVYNLINIYKAFGSHPNFGRLPIDRSAATLLAAPSTPSDVVDTMLDRAQSGTPVKHKDVKEAVSAAKGPTEFQARVGDRIVATLRQYGPLSLPDVIKFTMHSKANVLAALLHRPDIAPRLDPEGADLYWFAAEPFPADGAPEPDSSSPRVERGLGGEVSPAQESAALHALTDNIPIRQREFLVAVATGQPVVKNAATRTALINRGLIQSHDPADGDWWDVIKLTELGRQAANFIALWNVIERTPREPDNEPRVDTPDSPEAGDEKKGDVIAIRFGDDWPNGPEFEQGPITHIVDEDHFEITGHDGRTYTGVRDELGYIYYINAKRQKVGRFTEESDEPSTPIPPHATEGPGETAGPMEEPVDPDTALIRRIIDELTRGDKGLLDLSETLGVPPPQLGPVLHRLATVKPIQIYRYSPPGRGGRSLYSLTPGARTTLSTPTPPVGKNGPGVPDSADPEVEGALQVRRDLEGACVTLLKAIDNFTRIKSITSLAALDADRLAETEKLLDQVYHRSTAARQHATGLIVQIRAQAPAPSV